MNHYKYDSLFNLLQSNTSSQDEIKTKYITLLSLLTDAPDMSTQDFYEKVKEVSTMGQIMICFCIDCDNNISIVGSGTIIYEPKIIHGGKYVGHIEDIVVDDKHRSMGIAKNILDELLLSSKYHDCYKVILDCKPELIEFYEKCGFELRGNQMAKYYPVS